MKPREEKNEEKSLDEVCGARVKMKTLELEDRVF
jgi:hypothetical protein